MGKEKNFCLIFDKKVPISILSNHIFITSAKIQQYIFCHAMVVDSINEYLFFINSSKIIVN